MAKSKVNNVPENVSGYMQPLNGSKQQMPVVGRKSVFVAYLFWLFGGIFGLHHFYLRRDRQAFIWATTLGGYFGIGWLGDMFKIRKYVEDANDDPKFLQHWVPRLKAHKKVRLRISQARELAIDHTLVPVTDFSKSEQMFL